MMTVETSWNAAGARVVAGGGLEVADVERAFKRARVGCAEDAAGGGFLGARRKAERDTEHEQARAAKRRCCHACADHVEEAVAQAVSARVDELCGDRQLADSELIRRRVAEGCKASLDEFQARAIAEVHEESRKKLEVARQWAQLKSDEGFGWQLMAEDEARLRLEERANWVAVVQSRERELERRATENRSLQLENVRLRHENAWLAALKSC